jgi:hypothetical protein
MSSGRRLRRDDAEISVNSKNTLTTTFHRFLRHNYSPRVLVMVKLGQDIL